MLEFEIHLPFNVCPSTYTTYRLTKVYQKDNEADDTRKVVIVLLLLVKGLVIQKVGIPLKTNTIKILKFGTPQTIAIIVLKIEKFDVTLH